MFLGRFFFWGGGKISDPILSIRLILEHVSKYGDRAISEIRRWKKKKTSCVKHNDVRRRIADVQP